MLTQCRAANGLNSLAGLFREMTSSGLNKRPRRKRRCELTYRFKENSTGGVSDKGVYLKGVVSHTVNSLTDLMRTAQVL